MDTEIHYCEEIENKHVSFFFKEGSSVRGRKILILGESLSKKGWIDSSRAFYDIKGNIVPTGKRLNEELAHIGLKLDECSFTEIAKCYIGKNRKLLISCGQKCAKHLLRQIDHFEPKIILTLGVITKNVIEKIFDRTLKMGETTVVERNGCLYQLLPLYHPSPASPFGHSRNIDILLGMNSNISKVLDK